MSVLFTHTVSRSTGSTVPSGEVSCATRRVQPVHTWGTGKHKLLVVLVHLWTCCSLQQWQMQRKTGKEGYVMESNALTEPSSTYCIFLFWCWEAIKRRFLVTPAQLCSHWNSWSIINKIESKVLRVSPSDKTGGLAILPLRALEASAGLAHIALLNSWHRLSALLPTPAWHQC